MRRFGDALRSWALRQLGVPCGAHGGCWGNRERWCVQPFGHSWSCSYEDDVRQPLFWLRRRRRGWADDE